MRSETLNRLIILIGLSIAWLPSFATPATAQPSSERGLELEEVRVQPSGGSEEFVVRMLLPLQAGSPLEPESLVQAREILEGSGFFSKLDLYTARGSRAGAVVLFVDAELDRSAHLETGFGYEPLDGWYLNLVGVRWNNRLTRGGNVRFGLRAGQRIGGFYAEATHPRVGGSPLDLRVDFASQNEEWLIHEGDRLLNQDIGRGRLHVGLRAPLGRGTHATLWAGISRAKPSRTLEGLEGAADEETGRLVPISNEDVETYRDLRLDLSFDRRDLVQPWRRGFWSGLRLRGSDIQDGGAFWRSDVDLHAALPIFGNGALALRARGVYAAPGTPYHLRSVVGGTGSIRGFRDASLSGPLGARAVLQSSAELRFPLVGREALRPRLIGVLFIDAGDHWDPAGVRRDVSAGAGYGLRVRIPWIQIFGVDVGIPLTDDVTGDPFWVHGTLGFTF